MRVSLASLSSSGRCSCRVQVVEHGAVDDIGKPALEDPECFESAIACGFAAGDQGSGVGVPVRLGKRDTVQRRIELAVARP